MTATVHVSSASSSRARPRQGGACRSASRPGWRQSVRSAAALALTLYADLPWNAGPTMPSPQPVPPLSADAVPAFANPVDWSLIEPVCRSRDRWPSRPTGHDRRYPSSTPAKHRSRAARAWDIDATPACRPAHRGVHTRAARGPGNRCRLWRVADRPCSARQRDRGGTPARPASCRSAREPCDGGVQSLRTQCAADPAARRQRVAAVGRSVRHDDGVAGDRLRQGRGERRRTSAGPLGAGACACASRCAGTWTAA